MSTLIVEFEAVSKQSRSLFSGPIQILDKVDLTMASHGLHAVAGPTGAGKTTVLRILAGLIEPTSGHVTCVPTLVAAAFQDPGFTGSLTARRNLEILAIAQGLDTDAVDSALSRTGLLDQGGQRVRAFTAASRRKLAIASTLLGEPDLVILDEPTDGLDAASVRDLRGLLRRLVRGGTSVMMATSSIAEVQHIADTVTVLSEGRVAASGDVATLLGRATRRGALVRVADPERAREVLDPHFEVGSREGKLHVRGKGETDLHLDEVTKTLADEGLYVSELSYDDAGWRR